MTIFAEFVSDMRRRRLYSIDLANITQGGQATFIPARHVPAYNWSIPSFHIHGFPADFTQEALDRLKDEAYALWRRDRLPLPFPEVAYVNEQAGNKFVYHVAKNADGTVSVTRFEKYPGNDFWAARLVVTASPHTEHTNVQIFVKQVPADGHTSGTYLWAFRIMTYLIVKPPKGTAQAPVKSATLSALNRKLPVRKQVPATTLITIDVDRLASPQTANLGTGGVRAPHNRKVHLRTIKRRDGTIDTVKVKECKIHGGGRARDYEVKA